GGNVTGVTFITSELVGKRLGLLCDLVPHATTIAYLRTDPKLSNVVTEQMTSEFLVASRVLGRQTIIQEVGSDQEFDAAFENIVERHAGGLVIDAHPLFDSNRNKLAALAARHKILTSTAFWGNSSKKRGSIHSRRSTACGLRLSRCRALHRQW